MTDSQHGFQRKRSCETQLALFNHDAQSGLDINREVDLIFADRSKAFDTVSHKLLITKRCLFGPSDQVIKWTNLFLSNRKHRVLDGIASDWADVSSGVPQGSVLGPLFFLMFINDLRANLTSTMRLFADDAVIDWLIENSHSTQLLQEDLNLIQGW